MLTVEALREYGANVDEGLGRCMGNKEFYLRLVGKCLEDGNYAKLQDSLAAGDWDQAFEAAHALKGVLGNLSITPMYTAIQDLTELLRPKQPCDYQELLAGFLNAKERLEALIGA